MKELKQYYQDIYNALPCQPKQKKQLLRQLKASVGSFLLDRPDADMTAVRQHFGTPEQIASSYLEEMDAPQLLKEIKVKHRIVKIIIALAACALLLWGVVMGLILLDTRSAVRGYYTEEMASSKIGD